jgi:putative multiple sugar transport system substrate-binding protein
VLQPFLDQGVLVVPSGETAFDAIATPKWDGAVAAARMSVLMEGYAARGETLDGFLSPNDGVAVAALEVLGGLGYGTPAKPWPVTCGQDADVPAVRQVAAGAQHATIYKDTRQLAEVAVSMVESLLRGEEPETNDVTSYDNGVVVVPSYLLAPQVVTAENYVEVLVESGYYTAQEIA